MFKYLFLLTLIVPESKAALITILDDTLLLGEYKVKVVTYMDDEHFAGYFTDVVEVSPGFRVLHKYSSQDGPSARIFHTYAQCHIRDVYMRNLLNSCCKPPPAPTIKPTKRVRFAEQSDEWLIYNIEEGDEKE